MDSPRGRIYQMIQVATEAAPMNEDYMKHMSLCLACRACETACPSGVKYGRLIEAARTDIENRAPRSPKVRLLQWLVFDHLLPSRGHLIIAAKLLGFYQRSGLQKLARKTGVLNLLGLSKVEALAPQAESPTFYEQYGKVFPAIGAQRAKVAVVGGCMANVTFARLNESTIRVLQVNGCEVHVPNGQTCCGALHVHAGLKERARKLARRNIDVFLSEEFDAIITNAAGCGSTLKEYDELLEHDPVYREQAVQFSRKMQDVTEFLVKLGLRTEALGPVKQKVTYQDSCHLAHGQKVKGAPRQLLKSIPGLEFREMPAADICCGSAGIYNVIHTDLSLAILDRKMANVNLVKPHVIATANPGCMLQLRAGVRLHGHGERVAHVVELLDESYAAGLEHANEGDAR